MICPKCHGLMVEVTAYDKIMDHKSCINCGKVIYASVPPNLHDKVNMARVEGHKIRKQRKHIWIIPEDWKLTNKELSEKYGVTVGWISHLRPVKLYNLRKRHGLSNSVQGVRDPGAGEGIQVSPEKKVEDRPGVASSRAGGGDRGGIVDQGAAQQACRVQE